MTEQVCCKACQSKAGKYEAREKKGEKRSMYSWVYFLYAKPKEGSNYSSFNGLFSDVEQLSIW